MRNLPDVPVRLIVLATLGVTLLIVLILLLAALLSGQTGAQQELPEPTQESALEALLGPLQQHHFLIPNPEREYVQLHIVPFREYSEPWSQEEIGLFWRDPLKIGLEDVEKQNRELIQDLYSTIP